MATKRAQYTAEKTEAPVETTDSGYVKGLDKTPIGEPFGKTSGTDLPVYEVDAGETRREATGVVETAEDLITRVIDLEDDPTQDPWTFRVFFLGALR
jgi:hypothetical protein